MITLQEVENRLAEAGLRTRYWGRPEVRELQHIIMPDEAITHALNGRYDGGFCLLVATDRRLLLVDKKPLALNLFDLRYEVIAEIEYVASIFDSTIKIRTLNKVLRFTSMKQSVLRRLTSQVQERVMDLRLLANGQSSQMVTFAHDPTTGEFSPVTDYASMQNVRSSMAGTNMPPITFTRRVSRFYPNT